ncbi:hypothetical protein GO993_01000 [Aeromonas salmonicida subsp. salmonicida]|uniref:hypothetical protein n=1 Tax=Aeromonas salmonicida TaxID=645 RepID=UPI00131FD7F9|nr:hypothetical protein [Aeromonas salmonicida]QHE46845.1 hypothetical protein GO994_05510 [Aeromonas salmonicida subsp. salmonicida]QJF54635.1 hypothetical protein GO993_01000 [Aeromonas salmonicida subsp. salmonicida]
MKRFTHDADLRGMVVLRSLGFQLVPFKLHRFRKQRLKPPILSDRLGIRMHMGIVGPYIHIIPMSRTTLERRVYTRHINI